MTTLAAAKSSIDDIEKSFYMPMKTINEYYARHGYGAFNVAVLESLRTDLDKAKDELTSKKRLREALNESEQFRKQRKTVEKIDVGNMTDAELAVLKKLGLLPAMKDQPEQ